MSTGRRKLLLPAVLAVALLLIAAYLALDLGRYADLDFLKSRRDLFKAYYADHPIQTIAAYFVIYILVTGLSLPGASIITLAGGAMFGLALGTVLTSFASALGATVAFLIARYLLRDWVRRRFRKKVEAIDKGVARDGVYYLLTLRLVPLVPFVVINVAMGLTTIRTWTFYWVSQLGMLPGTIVYVNAGTQLAQINRVSDILSFDVIGAFVLLGVFPLLAREALRFLKRRKAYAGWKKPARFERNIVVIGAGAAGLVTAYIGAAAKAKVTLIESHKMGGDCLNYGCVPSKALIRTARFLHQAKHAEALGIAGVETSFDFAEVMERVQRIIRTIAPRDSEERYAAMGVEIVRGYARIVSPWEVEVNGRRIATRAIVIAAGARPLVPPVPGLEDVGYLTSDTLWSLRQCPRRLVVLGGGPIGCEMAQTFARFGAQVTQVEMGPRLLGREDAEAAEVVSAALAADGIKIMTGCKAVRCERDGDRKILFVVMAGHAGEKPIEFDQLLCAVGRAPRTEGYGLEELGIPLGAQKTIETDEYLQTLYPNIFVCGDAAGPYQFTHTAAHQAWYASFNALFGGLKRLKADYRVVPRCTFTSPELAHVGLSEQEAKDQQLEFEVTRYEMAELDRAVTDEATSGFVKVLTVPGKDRILGVTIVAEHAGEMLAEYVLAMKHGIGLNKILGTIHAYPTMAEANKFAAGVWKRAHAPQRLLNLLGRYHAWRLG